MRFALYDACDSNTFSLWNLDFVWTRVFVGCYGVKMKLYFHSKNV